VPKFLGQNFEILKQLWVLLPVRELSWNLNRFLEEGRSTIHLCLAHTGWKYYPVKAVNLLTRELDRFRLGVVVGETSPLRHWSAYKPERRYFKASLKPNPNSFPRIVPPARLSEEIFDDSPPSQFHMDGVGGSEDMAVSVPCGFSNHHYTRYPSPFLRAWPFPRLTCNTGLSRIG
jgi:hypothetical protein